MDRLRKAYLILISSFILLPEAFQIVIVLVPIVFGFFFNHKQFLQKIDWHVMIHLVILPVLYLISALLSDNLDKGIDYFGKISLLPVFGLIFYGFFSKEFILKNKMVMIFTLFLSGLLKLGYSLIFSIQKSNFSNFWRLREGLEESSDIHGTYWGIFFGIMSIISAYELFVLKPKKAILNYVIFTISMSVVIYLDVKMPLIAMLVSLFFLLFKGQKSAFIKGVLLTGGICAILILLPHTGKRYFTEAKEFIQNHEYPKGIYTINHEKISSLSVRFGIYNCIGELVCQSPFLGYGMGDISNELNWCYFKKYNTNVYQEKHFNSHSQYFGVLLGAGLLGLIVFLFLIFRLFVYLITTQNQKGMAIAIFLCLSMLTENIFDRHYGILMVSFFVSFYMLDTKEKTYGTNRF